MATIPRALQLLEKNDKGEQLTTDERRHVVAYLIAMEPENSGTAELSERLRVSDFTIRADKKLVRTEKAKAIKEDDIGLIIADLNITLENTMRELQKGLAKTSAGTKIHLEYAREIAKVHANITAALQSLGYYPKNLGTLTKKEFKFKAIVHKDGSVETRPVELLDHLLDDEDKNKRDALDAEFSDLPAVEGEPELKALPAPASGDSNAAGQEVIVQTESADQSSTE